MIAVVMIVAVMTVPVTVMIVAVMTVPVTVMIVAVMTVPVTVMIVVIRIRISLLLTDLACLEILL